MTNTEQSQPVNVEHIRDTLVAQFGINLECILHYGSSKEEKTFWDVDILVILKDKIDPVRDVVQLRHITESFPNVHLDLQLIYHEEIGGVDWFSLGASGSFFSNILKKARVLHGDNPFVNKSPTDSSVVVSLLARIQGYLFKARQEGMGMERYDKDQNPQYHQKHIHRAIYDTVLLFESCEDETEALHIFSKRFPGVFTDEQWQILKEETPNEHVAIDVYIPLYETIYTIALKSRKILTPDTLQKPERDSLNGMVFEYIIPSSYTTAIIVIDGLPRKPELSEFLNLLASWGYAVFYPRLRGTWESRGGFLDHNPADDVRELVVNIQSGVLPSGTLVSAEECIVIGSSFGGMVALCASVFPEVSRAIALSPPHLMSRVHGISTLGAYIQKYFGEAYRHNLKDWDELIHDKHISLPSLVSQSDFNPKKCTIMTGLYDEQIPQNELATFVEEHNIQSIELSQGHLTFHKDTRTVRPILHTLLRGEK